MDSRGLWVVLGFFSLIPLGLLIANWRKVANPVIQFLYNLTTLHRRKEYLPPKISIEGFGIKRGLDATEAAVLMEKPLDEIMGIVLLEAIEKQVVKITSLQPLKFVVARLLPKDLPRHVKDLSKACAERAGKRRQKLVQAVVELVRTTEKKMAGFSLAETIHYYESVVDARIRQAGQQGILTAVSFLIGDLSAFTEEVVKKTNPPADAPLFKEEPAYMKSGGAAGSGSSGHGYIGGGGGGCACACAGCACACACAGCACACAGGGR